ncbi:MAG: prolyl oligopeptidase family serine peptidase [Candidatus Latescibacteria bacterium]|jgi:dipeptidyl aminopeptidase/acylaminoacyl peptidase|nr:prolyl oligopeptidase family serine peptidase [Candidatus Latescibacterota bacterium]
MDDPGSHTPYTVPPKPIADLIDAPATPSVSLSPDREWILIMDRPSHPPIAVVSRPELRIAGLRIDPRTSGPSRAEHLTGLTLKRIADGHVQPITGLPEEARIGHPRWSPDSSHIAFAILGENRIDLWVAGVPVGEARKIQGIALNGVFGSSFAWLSDSRALVCRAVSPDRGDPPDAPSVPHGPVIQENIGLVAPSRTYQDLLESPYDETLFEYHANAQVTLAPLDGSVRPLGPSGPISHVQPAPGGQYLLVETIHRPFSYLVPYYRFPYRVEIWDRQGRVVRQVADLPLAEQVPIAFDAVPTGPRSFGWRADTPATLVWVEAQDGGDPANEADVRDRILTLPEPFEGEAATLLDLEFRYSGTLWGTAELALASERWWKTRRTRTWRLAPDSADSDPSVVFDRSWEDRYSDPGMPMLRPTAEGTAVLQTGADGGCLFLSGDGASPEGDRPFLDRYDLATGETERLWRSEPPYYERPGQLIDAHALLLLTAREAVDQQTNYYVRHLERADLSPVTDFSHPTPQLKDVQKELIKYSRSDGVQLTATLYLPPGHTPEREGPLPLVMWAYPREFKSADAAGQVKDSPHRFVRASALSPLPLLAHGYAVLDGPTLPIIGEGDAEANDTYVEQLVASAEAAVDEVVRRGVAERHRIAVGGHSYGGFMTANLLAHTDLFRAGVARSGAYNRTLTPFGFQAEERTLWQAPEVYASMSPFMHVDKITAPILLIHGEADNNAGTFPIQSERLYNALKGHGAIVRLVMLPHESHGYRARESVMHTLWETAAWLDTYVKNAGEPAKEE